MVRAVPHMAISSVAISLGQRLAAPRPATVGIPLITVELDVRVEPVSQVLPQAAPPQLLPPRQSLLMAPAVQHTVILFVVILLALQHVVLGPDTVETRPLIAELGVRAALVSVLRAVPKARQAVRQAAHLQLQALLYQSPLMEFAVQHMVTPSVAILQALERVVHRLDTAETRQLTVERDVKVEPVLVLRAVPKALRAVRVVPPPQAVA